MIKLFEQYSEYFDNYNKVEQWLEDMNVKNYIINDDLVVDVHGNVYLNYSNITEIPIKFGKVNGDFECIKTGLTSLKGCPNEIWGHFDCSSNGLKTLEGGPEHVGEFYNCNNNRLTSLKGCLQKVESSFNCNNNSLTTLEYAPRFIGLSIFLMNNNLTSLKGCPTEIQGSLYFEQNEVSSLKYCTANIGDNIYFGKNRLPMEVYDFLKTKLLLKYQEEYGIWNSDSSFNKARWDMFIKDFNANILT